MAQWTEIAKSGATGLVAGAVDQLITNKDEKAKRDAAAAGTSLSIWKQFGTYFNYGLPIGIVVACATNAVKGVWADRLVTVAGQLVGRKVTAQVTKAEQAAPWRQYSAPRALPAAPRSASPVPRTYQEEFTNAIAI